MPTAAAAQGTDFNVALQGILQSIVTKHKRILFNGDNYTAEWRTEAAKRGLPALQTTPEALKEKGDETKLLFDDVCSKTENLLRASRQLSSAVETGITADTLSALGNARECVDALEELMPSAEWPLPSYTDLLLMM